ncbi:hypothetical protein Pfo_016173 [Paulownia fortunei]|nr:hypothetical protein Pfo_016173 [Paulownia fortunei]
MGRAPCCEKMGLKKGPWSPEEDRILVSHIHQHGHANWRALPKQAGLLRCGKSCRLRWTNYLRPDVKRGNFSQEEEETIIKLHEMLGNRWSAIAARLPGRTDNEIKNVWHTHLKKKFKNSRQSSQDSKRHSVISNPKCDTKVFENSNFSTSEKQVVNSPQQCSSGMSNVTDSWTTTEKMVVNNEEVEYSSEYKMVVNNEEVEYSSEYFPGMDESFWSKELATEEDVNEGEIQFQYPLLMTSVKMDLGIDDGMDFWYNLFIGAGGMADLPEL